MSSLQEIENEIKKKDVLLNLNIYFQIENYIQSKTKKGSQYMVRIYQNKEFNRWVSCLYLAIPVGMEMEEGLLFYLTWKNEFEIKI